MSSRKGLLPDSSLLADFGNLGPLVHTYMVKQTREQVKGLQQEYNKTEDDLKALQVKCGACGGRACEGRRGIALCSLIHIFSCVISINNRKFQIT